MLLAAMLNSTVTSGQSNVCTSSIPEHERVDCAADVSTSATAGLCVSRSCVWCPASTPSIPYCFYDNATLSAFMAFLTSQCPSCSYCPFTKDCHSDPGASEARCVARGCQWCDYPNDIACGPKCLYGTFDALTIARLSCPNCTHCTKKVDCHPEPNADEGKCLSRGCRWCPMAEQPYCVFSDIENFVTLARTSCNTCSACNIRVDCHPEPDATSQKCVAKNCLWCETTDAGQPFCVYGGATAVDQNYCNDCGNCTTKIACPPGMSNPTQLQCETYGCMWCPFKSFGSPMCVHRLL